MVLYTLVFLNEHKRYLLVSEKDILENLILNTRSCSLRSNDKYQYVTAILTKQQREKNWYIAYLINRIP